MFILFPIAYLINVLPYDDANEEPIVARKTGNT